MDEGIGWLMGAVPGAGVGLSGKEEERNKIDIL